MGHNTGIVSNCYSTSNVSGGGHGDWAAGLVNSNSGIVTNCYLTGSVSGGNEWGAGLVAINSGSVTYCYWDTQTSGQATSAGGTGKTTAEMQTAKTFQAWGTCGNEGVWTIDGGNDYPRLWWQNQPGEAIRLAPLSHLLTGTVTESDPFFIYTAQDLDTIANFPCEQNKHFRLMFLGGEGRQEDPYLVSTADQLNLLGMCPYELDAHLKLVADIDLSPFDGREGRPAFNIIAPDTDTARSDYQVTAFTGVFDGDGHTISDLTITGGDYLGLFGRLKYPAEVKDLGLPDINVSCPGYYASSVGGLVGSNGDYWGGQGGVIINCYSTGSVSGTYAVGGMVGSNDGSVTQCYSTGVVSGTREVGGLVGWNHRGNVTQCYSSGAVSGTDGIGGLMGGTYESSVAACFWDMQTSGQPTSAGGEGKTTAEMQTATTFLSAGWDFVGESENGTENIWAICEGLDYPKLAWQFVPYQETITAMVTPTLWTFAYLASAGSEPIAASGAQVVGRI